MDDLIDNIWEMEAAPEKLQSVQVPCMEVIYNCTMGKCIPRCNGMWLECANQVLSQNNYRKIMFARLILQKVCKTCCAKTFLLKPLSLMDKTFNKPANEKYAFGRTVDAEIIFLNNF